MYASSDICSLRGVAPTHLALQLQREVDDISYSVGRLFPFGVLYIRFVEVDPKKHLRQDLVYFFAILLHVFSCNVHGRYPVCYSRGLDLATRVRIR